MPKPKPKCDVCGAPSTTKMTIGPVTLSGKTIKEGTTRTWLCDEHAKESMSDLAAALKRSAGIR